MIRQLSTDLSDSLVELSKQIHSKPELGFKEHFASRAHIELLKKHSFNVEQNYLGCSTAFRAEFSFGNGPTIAFMAEYDALPQIGHACGHNLIGMISTGAAIQISQAMLKNNIEGKVIVFGTPAEETSGFKVELANGSALDGVDICLMAHPGDDHYPSGTSLALDALEFEFFGKQAHAASAPEKGINALDAVLNTFNSINALRQQTSPDVRIHGIICEGGVAPNIIPDYAKARFYVRAQERKTLTPLTQRIIECARAGALAAGAKLKHHYYESSYDNLISNNVLSKMYCDIAKKYGLSFSPEPRASYGSLDMGNISHKVPTIHPYFKIIDKGIAAHTPEFEIAAGSTEAHDGGMKVIDVFTELALTYFGDKSIQDAIKQAYTAQ